MNKDYPHPELTGRSVQPFGCQRLKRRPLGGIMQTVIKSGDRVLDKSHFDGGIAMVTHVLPEGKIIIHFDDGSIMWCYTLDMIEIVESCNESVHLD